MEVEERGLNPVGLAPRNLGQDVMRALVAVLFAFATGGVVAAVTGTLSPLYFVWIAFVGPSVFLALILGYGSRDRSVFAAKLLGALLGWALFLVLFWLWDRGSQWLFSFRTAVVVVGPLLAAGFVAAGEFTGELVLRRTRQVQSDGKAY